MITPLPFGGGEGGGASSFYEPCVFCSSVFFCEKENALTVRERALESSWVVLSLTEPTELTEPFCARFEPTEGLRHTEVTEAFQLTLAVTFCDIG